MLTSYLVGADSPFLENSCAFCKEAFVPDDEIVICPVDGARHHIACWQANENHCSAYGCTGTGEVGQPEAEPQPALEGVVIQENGRSRYDRSKVRTLPQVRFGCGRGCCLTTFLFMLLLIGATCVGLWVFADSFLNWLTQLTTAGTLLPHSFLILPLCLMA